MAFPPISELGFLVGKEIAQISFEPSGIHFIWWEGGEIHVMGNFIHRDEFGVQHRFGDVFHDPPSLLARLIQRKVIAIQANDHALALTFNDGQELTLDATGKGENGLIQFGTNLSDGWIVF